MTVRKNSCTVNLTSKKTLKKKHPVGSKDKTRKMLLEL